MPNARYAAVAPAKVAYLLNAEHPDNGGKAPFFLARGFRPGGSTVFEAALKQHPVAHEIETTAVTGHGVKYTVVCSLEQYRFRLTSNRDEIARQNKELEHDRSADFRST